MTSVQRLFFPGALEPAELDFFFHYFQRSFKKTLMESCSLKVFLIWALSDSKPLLVDEAASSTIGLH